MKPKESLIPSARPLIRPITEGISIANLKLGFIILVSGKLVKNPSLKTGEGKGARHLLISGCLALRIWQTFKVCHEGKL